MTWSAPAVYVNGALIDAADLNLISANLEYLKGQAGPIYFEDVLELDQSATPSTPASGRARIYPKTDGNWYGLDDAGIETLFGIRSGTSFPGSPATNQRFYRTDIGFLCYYDGTRWLTVHEYSETIQPVMGATLPHTDAAYVNNQSVGFSPSRSDYGIYNTRIQAWMFVATTNNGSNYWVLEVTNTGTVCATLSTIADAANTNLYKNTSVAVALATGRQYWQIRTSNNVGTPGNLSFAITVYYRLIIP